MYGIGGMWIVSMLIAIPLIIGFFATGKNLYQFLIRRGLNSKNALTTAFILMLLLAGVMSSPLFLAYPLVRFLVPVSYLYFLYVGGRQVIGFFTGGNQKAQAKPDDGAKDGDCGCDHHDHEHGEHEHGDRAPREPQVEPVETGEPVETNEGDRPVRRPRIVQPERSPADARREIERRIAEGEGKK